MKDYKYTTIFSSHLKPLVSEEKDKYLSMASLENIGKFIPNIDTNKEIDLLPVAFNACVANRVNKNGDVIDTETSISICKSFINKQINLEHDRKKVVGVILTAGFSEFGSDVPLEEEQLVGIDRPFNITLGGVIWRVTNSELANLIEESSDPTSTKYMKMSASWELGFSDYHIVAIETDSKNIEDGVVFTDEEEIDALKDHLQAFGGTGKLEDGTKVYRKVINTVVPLGIGLTESPAADVKGIITQKEEFSPERIEPPIEPEKDQNMEEDRKNRILKNIENNSSQLKEKNVKEDKEIRVTMKINSIRDITDDVLNEVKATDISNFISQEIKKAADEYNEKKQHVDKELEAAKEKHEELIKQHDEMAEQLSKSQEDMENVKSSLETLEQEKVEREAQEKFNQRMASLDEKFALTDDDREVIANDIKDLDEEQHEVYSKRLSVLLRDKDKELLAEKAKSEEEAKASESAQTEEKTEEIEEVVETAVDNAEEEEEAVANSTTADSESVYEKYRHAFSVENFEIESRQ